MRGRSAHTLIEMLVTCAVLGVATTATWGFFSYGLQAFTQADARSDVQRQAVAFYARFQRNFQDAPWASVTAVYPSGNPNNGDLALAFLSNISPTTGQAVVEPGCYLPIFQSWCIDYCDTTTQTIRSAVQPLTPPTLTLAVMSPTTLLASIPVHGAHLAAQNVVGWRTLDYVTGAPISLLQNPTRFQLTLLSSAKQQIQLELRCKLLN